MYFQNEHFNKYLWKTKAALSYSKKKYTKWNNYFSSAHLVLVVPEYVGGRLRAELNEAGQVDSGADVYVQVWPS